MIEHDDFKIEQCLFGYRDGHRMLESSFRLPGDIASDLTAASDVAPGTRFGGSDGYWTGFPVPRLSRYGLMRTWPAPEMPRPGCVWTHLLLFNPVLFEEIDDLSCFETMARRPSGLEDRAGFAEPLAFHQQHLVARGKTRSTSHRDQVIAVLEVLYGSTKGPVRISHPGELDTLVFAVWSQQWPKLRRNFRFQTAAATGAETSKRRFDLQLRIDGPSTNRGSSGHAEPGWLEAAVDDIGGFSGHALRSFLRKYGQDVRRQRGSFRPLAELFVQAATGTASNIAGLVVRWFSEPDDAATLKRDLMDGLIFPAQQVETILYLCEVDKGRSLPEPSEEGLRNLAQKWSARSFDLMRLAERAATEQGAFADAVLSTIANVVPPDRFWSVTDDFPEMRRRMVANQPDLLDAMAIADLDTTALIGLVDAVPEGYDIGGVLVRRLHAPVERRVAAKALDRFPASALQEVIEKANTTGLETVRDWLREFASVPSMVLDPNLMRKIGRLSIVVAIAEALDWLSGNVVKHGLSPWTAALEGAQDDLSQADRDRLEAFLFTMALLTGGEKAEQVFERSFGYLHGRIIHSYLAYPALRLLQPKLPSAGLFRDWDDGLKLRLAVSEAYVRFGLHADSFNRLLHEKRERKMLRKAAEEVPWSDRFTDALRD